MGADNKWIKQDSLPFPPTRSASIAGRTMLEPVYKRRVDAAKKLIAIHRKQAESMARSLRSEECGEL